MKTKLLTVCLALVSVFSSCTLGDARHDVGRAVALRHATMLTIDRHDGYDLVTIADPWDAGRTLHAYCLVPGDSTLPDSLPPATVIRTPLRRAVVATSVHCSLLMELGCGDAIAGVCDLQYINLPWLQRRAAAGAVVDCGSSMSPTIERLIALQPDAVFLSPFQNSGGYGRVEELGVPIVEMADYMEAGPLARAEWMLFYGMLFGAEERADSLFRAVERSYTELATLAARQPRGLTLLVDKPAAGVWYVPGGRSTIGRLIADAHAGYPWAADSRSGSIALSFESVLAAAADAQAWLVRYYGAADAPAFTADEGAPYAPFAAWRQRNVWTCNTAVSTFYEGTPFHPDRLLRDIIIVAHPELTDLGEPQFFRHI